MTTCNRNSFGHQIDIDLDFDLLSEEINMHDRAVSGVDDDSSGGIIPVFSLELQVPQSLEAPPSQPPLNEI